MASLEEEALVWFQDAEESGLYFTSLDAFVRALQVRFGTTTYGDPMEALTRLSKPLVHDPNQDCFSCTAWSCYKISSQNPPFFFSTTEQSLYEKREEETIVLH